MSPIPYDRPMSYPDTHLAAAHMSLAVDRIDQLIVDVTPSSLRAGEAGQLKRSEGQPLGQHGGGVVTTPEKPYALVCRRLGRWWGPFCTADQAVETAQIEPALEDAALVVPPPAPTWCK